MAALKPDSTEIKSATEFLRVVVALRSDNNLCRIVDGCLYEIDLGFQINETHRKICVDLSHSLGLGIVLHDAVLVLRNLL